MIFVTVGTQLPFPRLLSAMNDCATELDEPVVAQTCSDDGRWSALECHGLLQPDAFARYFSQARIVVAHAGIGSVLSARRWNKPLVLMPRRHDLGEHRNDHQLATARRLEGSPGIHIAREASDLSVLLKRGDLVGAMEVIDPQREALLTRLRDFIDD